MKLYFTKTAAFLLIFALILALPAGLVLGEGTGSGVLKRGDRGDETAALQRELRALALLDFEGEPSGEFDGETELAVKELQRILNVDIDGIFGANTRGALTAAVESGRLSPVYVEDLPLYGCIIGIDAGHQGEADLNLEPVAPGSLRKRFSMTEGCFGVRTNMRESIINLKISLMLTGLLEKLGAKVVNCRTSEDVSISNISRASLMNSSEVDFWIRLHCDSCSDPSVFGARILLPNAIHNFNIASRSAFLGECVINSYCSAVNTVRLLPRSLTGETGFNWSAVPVVTLELGYLSNAASDLALSSAEYQQKCAEGILFGIAEYYFGCGAVDAGKYFLITGSHGHRDSSAYFEPEHYFFGSHTDEGAALRFER